MDVSVLPSKLLSDLSSAVDIVRRHHFIHIYSHFDTDGLTAASIVAKALMREGKEFCIKIFPVLSESQMEIIETTESKCTLVTDLGASYIKRFDAMGCDVIVLDHHTVFDRAERICYANPHLYGIDGANAGCGASMAFLFAIKLNEKNWDLAPLAMTGIAGDMQHKEGLKGLNVFIHDEAVKRGYVEDRPGSLIPIGNLSTELYMSTSPFVKGISGNSLGTSEFLKSAGITPNRNFDDLTPEERVKLSSLIAVKLIDQGVTRESMEYCTRTRYYLPAWGTDAESLSSVINACGRQEQQDIGIATCLGDSAALEIAKTLDSQSRKEIMDAALDVINNGKIHELNHIQWFDNGNAGYTGLICTIVMDFIGNPEKPTIGINTSEAVAKASSRGSKYLIKGKNIDLALAMKQACSSIGGEGGGHDIAAGGSFPSEKRDEFLQVLDLVIEEQLKNNEN